MRIGKKSGFDATDESIPLSPLIDCVFLLLIFFLVTTMLKRKETMIPVAMPDATSSLSANAHEDVLVVGLDEAGGLLIPTGKDRYGALTYQAGGDLREHLRGLLALTNDAIYQPLRLDIARTTPFQKTIDAIDACKQLGFTRVSVKLRQPFEE